MHAIKIAKKKNKQNEDNMNLCLEMHKEDSSCVKVRPRILQVLEQSQLPKAIMRSWGACFATDGSYPLWNNSKICQNFLTYR